MSSSKDRLLGLSRNSTESDIKNSIMSWLLDVGIECGSEQRTDTGPVDIHLRHRHVIIEVKKRNKLEHGPAKSVGGSRDETALDQLGRYLDHESRQTSLDELSWLGAVTDGNRWWIYKWSDSLIPLPDWQGRVLSPDNMAGLDRVLRRDNVGRPWPPLVDLGKEFKDVRDAIRTHYGTCKGTRNTKTQMKLWLEQLRGTGNLPRPQDQEGLFLDHTFLILASRMISGMRKNDQNLLSGFVGWLHGSTVADIMGATVAKFNWAERRRDYLRGLYQDIVRADQRHAYGEYYTPDWLAQKLCSDIIDEQFMRDQVEAYKSGKEVLAVMDPACGSGTFLYHAAIMLLNSTAFESLYNDEDKPRLAAKMIVGIDIHPVAVEMAISNVMRAIGQQIPRNQIRIYQGDSLLLAHQNGGSSRSRRSPRAKKRDIHASSNGQTTMMGETFGVEAVSLYAPENLEILLPVKFIEDSRKINDFVGSARDNKPMPVAIMKKLSDVERKMVANSHQNMTTIINKFGDGVWAWYIRNQAAPLMLAARKSAGRIVANPPWVRINSMNDVQRQDAVKNLGERLEVYVGGQQATSFNLATVFVRHCMERFATRNAKTAWVLPRGAGGANKQWEKLRGFYEKITVYDLGSFPFPKQDAAAALLTGMRGGRYKLESKIGIPSTTDMWFGHLDDLLRFKRIKEPKFSNQESSWFSRGKPVARQGATIVPVPYLHIKDLSFKGNRAVFTTRTLAKSMYQPPVKTPYNLPKSWIKQVISSKSLGPFRFTTVPVVLPVDKNGKWLPISRLREKYWTEISDMYHDIYVKTSAQNQADVPLSFRSVPRIPVVCL